MLRGAHEAVRGRGRGEGEGGGEAGAGGGRRRCAAGGGAGAGRQGGWGRGGEQGLVGCWWGAGGTGGEPGPKSCFSRRVSYIILFYYSICLHDSRDCPEQAIKTCGWVTS